MRIINGQVKVQSNNTLYTVFYIKLCCNRIMIYRHDIFENYRKQKLSLYFRLIPRK